MLSTFPVCKLFISIFGFRPDVDNPVLHIVTRVICDCFVIRINLGTFEVTSFETSCSKSQSNV